jgi:hypothetical protein
VKELPPKNPQDERHKKTFKKGRLDQVVLK